MTTQKGKKTRYMRELRVVVADILIKKSKAKKSRRFECEMDFTRSTFSIEPKSALIQEYNIVDTSQDRTLGIAIKVRNTRRFSEKIEKRGWKVLNVSSHKNCGSDEELPLTIFTVRK